MKLYKKIYKTNTSIVRKSIFILIKRIVKNYSNVEEFIKLGVTCFMILFPFISMTFPIFKKIFIFNYS